MILIDVNVLVYAHREDADRHEEYRGWLENAIGGDAPFGVADLGLSGFLRVVTHRRIFATPTPVEKALTFVDELRAQPNCVVVEPGRRHWDIFANLCREAGATGNLVPDCYFAAMAIESGCEWITTDVDFARFSGLKHRHPLGSRHLDG